MITKARLTEDGNFQVDKEIIEYPEILSGRRNLFKPFNDGYAVNNQYRQLRVEGGIVYWKQLTTSTHPQSITIYNYDTYRRDYTFSYKTNAPVGLIRNYVNQGGRLDTKTTIEDKGDYRYVIFNISDELTSNSINWYGTNPTDPVEEFAFWDFMLEKGNVANPSTPAPEDLGLSYPSSIQNFVPSIHDDFILMPEIIESSISDKLQISPTQLKIPNLLIEQSIVPKYAASENLILHYDFKGKRNVDSDRGIAWDHSGNNNNGQLYNFVYNQTTGYDGIGLTFADNQYIKFGNIIQPETEEVTIDILINITSDSTTGAACTLFCCRNKLGEGITIFSFNNGIIRIDIGTIQWSSAYSIQYNTPTKITVTRDSNKRSLYINNQFHSSNNNPGNFSGLGLVTTMGASQVNDTGYGNFLNGIIYSTKIYNRALTPEEITHNFQIDKLRFNINI